MGNNHSLLVKMHDTMNKKGYQLGCPNIILEHTKGRTYTSTEMDTQEIKSLTEKLIKTESNGKV